MPEVGKTQWRAAAKPDEIAPGHPKIVQLGRYRIALFRIPNDPAVYAIEDICTHDDGPLAEGFQDNNEIECPRHGARFDIRTGAVLCMPAVTPVRAFKAREANGQVEVEIPEE